MAGASEPGAGMAGRSEPGAGMAGRSEPAPGMAGASEPGAGMAGASEPGASRTVVLALGSNVGDRLANLQGGLDALCGAGLDCPGLDCTGLDCTEFCCTAVSAVFQTAPVGGPEQDDFLNAIVLAGSSLPAAQILRRCQSAEAALGRVRTVRWGPRTLDVDIIACGAEVTDDPELTLPHPRAHERAFVLAPWLDVAPDAFLPGHGPVAGLLAALGSDGIRRLPGVRLALPAAATGPAGARCT
jgi:2-amino-4-hydroxy-6-hydroxymethyldihydropteridine diphosphokinase